MNKKRYLQIKKMYTHIIFTNSLSLSLLLAFRYFQLFSRCSSHTIQEHIRRQNNNNNNNRSSTQMYIFVRRAETEPKTEWNQPTNNKWKSTMCVCVFFSPFVVAVAATVVIVVVNWFHYIENVVNITSLIVTLASK